MSEVVLEVGGMAGPAIGGVLYDSGGLVLVFAIVAACNFVLAVSSCLMIRSGW